MSNKSWFVFLATASGLAVFTGVFQPFNLCGEIWRECMGWNYFFAITLQPFIIFFFTFVFVSRLVPPAMKAWNLFALIWIPVSIVAVLLAPEYRTDFLYGFDKGSVSFFSSAFFVLGSLGIVLWQRFIRRGA